MRNLLYILILGLIVFGCDDFFETDLSEKTVTLIAPADGLQTSNSSFTFWWNEVDGASKYNLQVVSPNFNAIEKLVLDTNLTTNLFEVQLFPGNFQWRVKAFNGSSETEYTIYSLSVDSTLDISGSEVILSNPSDNYASGETSTSFSWNEIYNAKEYNIKIRKDNWESGDQIVSETTGSNNYTYEISDEGNYIWGVRALNDNSATIFTTRNLIIDRTDPNLPSQTSPDHGETLTSTSVTFTWTRPADSGSDILEDILIGTDSTFTTGVLKDIKGLDLTYTTSFSVTTGSTQTYYWKIKSVDKAGNESAYTEFRTFKIKNEK